MCPQGICNRPIKSELTFLARDNPVPTIIQCALLSKPRRMCMIKSLSRCTGAVYADTRKHSLKDWNGF